MGVEPQLDGMDTMAGITARWMINLVPDRMARACLGSGGQPKRPKRGRS
jgi:hypothetical protein